MPDHCGLRFYFPIPFEPLNRGVHQGGTNTASRGALLPIMVEYEA